MSVGYSAGIETAGTAPSARWGHTAVRFDDCLIIYGGRSAEAEVLADCHIFNFGLNPLSPAPCVSCRVVCVRVTTIALTRTNARHAVVVAGGESQLRDASGPMGSCRCHLQGRPPSSRRGIQTTDKAQRGVHVPLQEAMYVMGGENASGNCTNDTWKLNLGARALRVGGWV